MHSDIEKFSYNVTLERNVQDIKWKIKVVFTKKIMNKTQEHHRTIFSLLLIIDMKNILYVLTAFGVHLYLFN